jgi:molecular chaperone DnaJ
MLSRDHYAVLGVAPDADTDTIEAAYRRLSRRYHPDLNPGDARAQAAFERIRLAYQVLTDEGERRRYDREGQPVADEIEVIGVGEVAEGATPTSFPELFRRLCDHARRTRPQRGGDVHATVSCRLADAERGRRTTVEIRRLGACRHCGGRGLVRVGEASACSRCRGSGKEVFARGPLNVAVPCADCGGEGVRRGAPCSRCHASGLCSAVETVAVQIPPGVLDGQEIRVRGAGHLGRRGGPPGDLVVSVRLQDHPHFQRHGPHLVARMPVSVSEAILGGRVTVPTLEGAPASARIPPGVRPGQKLRVRGKGLEMANGLRGDLILQVEVWLPDVVDEDAKRLIREFGERTPTPDRPATRRATVQR